MAIIQVRDLGNLGRNGSSAHGEKWLTLDTFVSEFDVGCKRKKTAKDDPRVWGLGNWKAGIPLLLTGKTTKEQIYCRSSFLEHARW